MTSPRTRRRLVERLKSRGIRHPDVLAAVGAVPRHIFVDEALAHRSYEDSALPIGFGQTISQPYIVAMMTEALIADGPDRVLEIGTGSGYQTAVLAHLVRRVYSVERIGGLIERAAERLEALALTGVRIKHDDGAHGWSEQGPFDAIMITAAAPEVPAALLDQLADGGRLVAPVGGEGQQALLLLQRDGERILSRHLEAVRFVPFLNGIQN